MMYPIIEGRIRRRILVNYRVDPDALRPWVPQRFQITTVRDYAMAGICLIGLDGIHPKSIATSRGLASENVAYRVAVQWEDDHGVHPGVYIPRRDTSSGLQSVLGGHVFPGEYHHGRFVSRDEDGAVDISCYSDDGHGDVRLIGHETDRFPTDSVFDSLSTASSFFEKGSIGYSATSKTSRLDGVELRSRTWKVAPLRIELAESSFFDDHTRFPKGTVIFDNALIMRNVDHEWHALPQLDVKSGLVSRIA